MAKPWKPTIDNYAYYVWMVYVTPGPHQGEEEWIGPFLTPKQAKDHRYKYGPVDSIIVSSDADRQVTMSPEEHATYMEGRI